MFAYLQGAFKYKTPTSLIVDVGGVGYEVHISLNTYGKIESREKGMLWVQFIVREDSQTLYGFAEQAEKQLFNNLISVSGIGPNTARLILSGMTPEAVNEAILNEDVPSFKRVKGVGPKTAKRLIMELKDKVESMPGGQGVVIPADSSNTARQEALSALVALGFQRAQIQKAMNKVSGTVDEGADTEAWIKASLQVLTGQR